MRHAMISLVCSSSVLYCLLLLSLSPIHVAGQHLRARGSNHGDRELYPPARLPRTFSNGHGRTLSGGETSSKSKLVLGFESPFLFHRPTGSPTHAHQGHGAAKDSKPTTNNSTIDSQKTAPTTANNSLIPTNSTKNRTSNNTGFASPAVNSTSNSTSPAQPTLLQTTTSNSTIGSSSRRKTLETVCLVVVMLAALLVAGLAVRYHCRRRRRGQQTQGRTDNKAANSSTLLDQIKVLSTQQQRALSGGSTDDRLQDKTFAQDESFDSTSSPVAGNTRQSRLSAANNKNHDLVVCESFEVDDQGRLFHQHECVVQQPSGGKGDDDASTYAMAGNNAKLCCCIE